jgi:hypothetical protein
MIRLVVVSVPAIRRSEEAEDLGVGEPLTVDLRLDEPGQEIVARGRAARPRPAGYVSISAVAAA